MNNEKLIKVSTYAKEKGISVQTVYDKIKSGKLECKKIDGVTFVKVDDEN